jgi:hypothetical protein
LALHVDPATTATIVKVGPLLAAAAPDIAACCAALFATSPYESIFRSDLGIGMSGRDVNSCTVFCSRASAIEGPTTADSITTKKIINISAAKNEGFWYSLMEHDDHRLLCGITKHYKRDYHAFLSARPKL